MGPKDARYDDNPINASYYAKSVENNESAIYFLDAMYAATGNPDYKEAADKMYAWIKTMLIKTKVTVIENGEEKEMDAYVFLRGSKSYEGEWRNDSPMDFATDTTSWAPLERMLEDEFFGATKKECLEEMERMMLATLDRTGVMDDNGELLGLAFHVNNQRLGVVSIEWSSQFAIRYRRIAEEYGKLGIKAKEAEYNLKSDKLIEALSPYFKPSKPGANDLVAPYAVYALDKPELNIKAGDIAAGVNVGHGKDWNVPDSYASLASTYYVYAKTGIDPLLLGYTAEEMEKIKAKMPKYAPKPKPAKPEPAPRVTPKKELLKKREALTGTQYVIREWWPALDSLPSVKARGFFGGYVSYLAMNNKKPGADGNYEDSVDSEKSGRTWLLVTSIHGDFVSLAVKSGNDSIFSLMGNVRINGIPLEMKEGGPFKAND